MQQMDLFRIVSVLTRGIAMVGAISRRGVDGLPTFTHEQHSIHCLIDDVSYPYFISSAGNYDPEKLSVEICSSTCRLLNFEFAGIASGKFCLCTNDSGFGKLENKTTCTLNCPTGLIAPCGGSKGEISVYKAALSAHYDPQAAFKRRRFSENSAAVSSKNDEYSDIGLEIELLKAQLFPNNVSIKSISPCCLSFCCGARAFERNLATESKEIEEEPERSVLPNWQHLL
ncbi:unnamed protein product [Notodromas monacha]|uniref:WSC domain-containing protein n=1 Tax=Notodromas monacha TaxID=399045 RepID=A0A7R9BJJ2_9CRUS|nr:unnamed protein product [Notodromas monacha]CAG0916391.1 unnamed protein product [Notodromas monacha]